MNARFACVISCEHGGNRIPARYAASFQEHLHVLNTHRGYDHGALALARTLARALDAPLVAATVSRLLVDLNRSPAHRQLFSSVTRGQPEAARRAIVERYYVPHRQRVEAEIARLAADGRRVVHIGVHSFTPRLRGVSRHADIGLLYDPGSLFEAALCRAWKEAFRRYAPRLRVRRNYPYRGTSDGLTRTLRRRFGLQRYAGIELELNQARVLSDPKAYAVLCKEIADCIRRGFDKLARGKLLQ